MATQTQRTTYTALDFASFREQKSLDITPEFQRRSVWKKPAKSYFIDTLLRGLPVPPIYLRVMQSEDKKRTIRQVIDGQQRISTLLDYVDGKFSLASNLEAEYAGLEFGELDEDQQDAIREYPLLCEVLQGVSDARVLEIFQRLNTYSVQLNAQELRNGRYFGYFKQTAYRLAHEHLQFWLRNRIVTHIGIARMQEVELTSELLVLQLDGLKDKKQYIYDFYAQYDEEFPEREQCAQRFRKTVDEIVETLGDLLANSEFHRRPLFYSLFGVMYHRMFAIPGLELPTEQKPLNAHERKSLRTAVIELSDAVSAVIHEQQRVPKHYAEFVGACQRQTDNIGPRRIRLETLYHYGF